jgi:hypothetical protein
VRSAKTSHGNSLFLGVLRSIQKRDLSRFSLEQNATSHMRSEDTLLVKIVVYRIRALTLGAVYLILALSKGTFPRAAGVTALEICSFISV